MTWAAAAAPSVQRYALLQAPAATDDFADDVRRGLTASPKTLPPKYFYDALGSALFEAICQLPEYYVTRAETEILTARAEEMARAFGPVTRLVELGSGSSRKTRILLDALASRALEYVPIDVDADMLEKTSRELLGEYPNLRITAIRSDFRDPRAVLELAGPATGRTVALFLGSSIGNLDPSEAAAMLSRLRAALRSGDALFLGADLVKPIDVLEPAYDDALGVTAAFNRNVLRRINDELGGAFDLATFDHRALFNREQSRIEMHLVSRIAQSVRIEALDIDVAFEAGESIHTENSYKYDDAMLDALAAESGFAIAERWTDSRGWFADLLFV